MAWKTVVLQMCPECGNMQNEPTPHCCHCSSPVTLEDGSSHNSRYVTALSVYKEFSNSIYGATPSGFRAWLEGQLNAEKDQH